MSRGSDGPSLVSQATLDRVLAIGREAAAGIARVYAGEFAVEYKAKDDPVTRADKEANALICAEIAKTWPGVPIVAEESEGSTYEGYAAAPRAWFVDPLDGTREFVARNGEFAVMIGLAEAGRAVLGVLVCPALGRSFTGAEGLGAFELDDAGAKKPIRVAAHEELVGARVLVSRSHLSPDTRSRIEAAGMVVVPCGSAGVKAAKVACGEADLYVQPTSAGKLWDACAPEAIVRAAGGVWLDARGDAYSYTRGTLENVTGIAAGNARLVTQMVERFRTRGAS